MGLVLVAGSALAFPSGSMFDDDPVTSTGGGGVQFTGTPRFAEGTCASCHTDGSGRLGVRLESDDVALFARGYEPERIYQLEVVLVGETRGAELNGPARCGDLSGGFVPCNSNGFALEADDDDGNAVGLLCPTMPNDGACAVSDGALTIVSTDHTAIHNTGYLLEDASGEAGFENGATHWTFYWLAPSAGTGPVTFHVGGVDGNGGEGTTRVPHDLGGDDAVQAHIEVAEAGAPPSVASTSCGIASRRGTHVDLSDWVVIAISMGVMTARARTRARRSR
jgi:hypothetical protein